MKRTMAAYLCLLAAFAGILLRMGRLSFAAVPAAEVSAARVVRVAAVRGTVYDCRMQPLTNAETAAYAAVKPTARALGVLQTLLPPTAYDAVRARLSAGLPVVVALDAPIAGDTAFENIACPVRYSASQPAAHVIGHLNAEGQGATGIEKSFDALLTETAVAVTARFYTDVQGKVLLGAPIEVAGAQTPQGGVVLTIDREIQCLAEQVLDRSGYACAAAVVMEVESGAIRACVSRPNYHPAQVALALEAENAPLINRAFSAFSVGSVFKPAVAAAALERGADTFRYTCTGSINVGGVTFHCHKEEGHGAMDLEAALAQSCNTYFIALGQRLGKAAVTETAAALGFGSAAALADGLTAAAGNLPDAKALDSAAALANLSFGQGQLTATPLQICAMTAAIANGGVRVQPSLVAGTRAADGTFAAAAVQAGVRVLSAQTAARLCAAMRGVVTHGSGKRAQSDLVAIAGKTATAQTGRIMNGAEQYNAWFTGFFPAESPRYAVTVLVEDGGEGAVSCAPLVREIAEALAKMNRI